MLVQRALISTRPLELRRLSIFRISQYTRSVRILGLSLKAKHLYAPLLAVPRHNLAIFADILPSFETNLLLP